MWSADLEGLVRDLRERHARTVALQFPEGLMRMAGTIAESLRKEGFHPFICADPCYGACDPADGTGADVLVHFGHTPLGKTGPDQLYIPWRIDIPLEALKRAIPLLAGRVTALVTTAQHAHQTAAIADRLRSAGIDCRVGESGPRTPLPGQVLGCSFSAARVPGATVVLYVGTGVFHPIGVRLATGLPVIALDPFSGTAGEIDADRILRRRFALIARARQGDRCGILISTKRGQSRRLLADRLVSLHPGAVPVLLREVTPDALLNLGFSFYVNTACPRLAYDDQDRFPVPVLSPPEFEILTGHRRWEDYIVDEIA